MVDGGQQKTTVVRGVLLGFGVVVVTGIIGAVISRMVDAALDGAAATSGIYRTVPWKVYQDSDGNQQAMVLMPEESTWAFIEPASETVEDARKSALAFIDYYFGPDETDDCGGGGDCD